MRTQIFINDWNSTRARSRVLYNHLRDNAYGCSVDLLESYDAPFSVQWEEAVLKFDGEIFVWAMADTFPFDPTQTKEMFRRMDNVYRSGQVAMYAPNVDWTSVVYNRKKLTEVIYEGVYEVAGTDLVFASLSRELLDRLPPLGNNTHAWAYDYLMAHIAKTKLGKKVVRDYNFLINHPLGKAYSELEAEKEKNAWIESLSPEYQAGIRAQMKLQEETCA